MALVHFRNPGLWHDVFRRVSFMSEKIKLEHVNIVLPAVSELLSSKCDECVHTPLMPCGVALRINRLFDWGLGMDQLRFRLRACS